MANGNNGTSGHEQELVDVQDLKASLKKGGNKGLFNEATCSTAAATLAKTVTAPTSFTLVSGATILVTFTNGISVDNATLAVGSTAAKPIYYKGAALEADYVEAGDIIMLRYDGTNFNVVGKLGGRALPEVQIGGNTPSSESEIKLFVDESADDTVEVYTKAQADWQFVAVVNMNTEPTESTLTYTSTDGTTKNFKVGDEVRVPDAEADNGYTFYKLYALTTEGGVTTATWDKLGAGGGVTTATWDKLGAGGAVVLKETVVIALSQQNGNNADLIGATIIITDDDSSEILFSTTWQGMDIETEVESNVNYTITVGSITGYMTPDSQSYKAIPTYIRSVEFTYNNNLGIYIESIDHKLYTASQWASVGKLPNSVVILTSTHQTCYAVTGIKNMQIHNDSWWNGADTYLVARGDTPSFDGKTDTDNLIALNAVKGTNNTSYAAPYAKAYVFPDGVGGSYFMSSGQALSLYNNATDVLACYGALDVSVSLNDLWTTTCYNYAATGQMCFIDGGISASVPSASKLVIPVRDYINN